MPAVVIHDHHGTMVPACEFWIPYEPYPKNFKGRNMKSVIIFHSHSGITRGVAEKIGERLGGDMIEVTPEKEYSSLMVVPKGCYRAMKGLSDKVRPDTIDVSGYDLVIIASPVWAGKPTPVINGAIDGLTGCQGKNVHGILTCRSAQSANEALIPFMARMKEKDLVVSGTAVLDSNDSVDNSVIDKIVADIRSD